MHLFAQTKDYMQVKIAMDSILSDNPDADVESYEMTMESIKALVSESAEGLAKYAKELEAVAKIQEEEAKSLKAEADRTKKRMDKLMENIAGAMKLMELEEVQAGAYKFKFKKGSEITEVDESKLPDKYWVTSPPPPPTRKPMAKNDLKKLVKDSGVSIPGVKVIRNPDKLELK